MVVAEVKDAGLLYRAMARALEQLAEEVDSERASGHPRPEPLREGRVYVRSLAGPYASVARRRRLR